MKFSGFILLETLVSVVLSSLLLQFLFSIYQTTKQSKQIQIYFQQFQSKNAILTALLDFELQHAGFLGYAHLTRGFPVHSSSSYTLTVDNRLIGNDHEIIVRKMELPVATLQQNMQSQGMLVVDKSVLFSAEDILIVADYWHAEIFQVAHVTQGKTYQIIYATKPLQQHFNKNAEIGRFTINKFYVDKTKRKHKDGTPIYALYRELLQNNTRFFNKKELLADVCDINFHYSVQQQNRVVELSAQSIRDWSLVIGVHYSFNLQQEGLKKIGYNDVAIPTVLQSSNVI